MSPTQGPRRRPRTDADFSAPDQSDELMESKTYQAQLAWTVMVALGVAAAAFMQVTSRTSQPILVQEAAERLRNDPMYMDALRASMAINPMEEGSLERRPAATQVYSSGRAPARRGTGE